MATPILINGDIQTTSCRTLFDLVQNLSLEGKRYAIEVNENIIPKSRFSEIEIQPNDRIEIIQAVGGG